MKRHVAVLILCGGKGERLRPLTESLPKPLVEIKGRPILSYLMDHVVKFGIVDIVIAAGFKSEKIREFFRYAVVSRICTLISLFSMATRSLTWICRNCRIFISKAMPRRRSRYSR